MEPEENLIWLLMSPTSIEDGVKAAASQEPSGSTLLARLASATSLILLQSHLADQNLQLTHLSVSNFLCVATSRTQKTPTAAWTEP